MGQRNVRLRTGSAALALALSLVLAAGAPLDAARAYAAGPSSETPAEGASQPEASPDGAGESVQNPSDDAGQGSAGQLTEKVPLEAPSGASADAPQNSSPVPADPDADAAANADSAGKGSSFGQASAAVPLVPEAPKAVVGEVVQDGLVYRVLPGGESVALVGWRGAALAGEVAVPSTVVSGGDAYAVTAIGDPDVNYADAAGVLAGGETASLSLPASVEAVVDGALAGCASLESVFTSPQNQRYASFDGMLFSKDLNALLFVPEGKRGVARIPDEAASAPAAAFSRASGLSAVQAGEGSAAFSSHEGVLYSKDGASLLYFPAAAGSAVVLLAETESIGEGAFANAEGLASIVALGYVRAIHETAFTEAAKQSAQVALPAGDDYDARKAVWEAAGFQSFVAPAMPGDVVEPSVSEGAPASGFAFTLLDDYTLAVSWTGESDPEADLVIPSTAKLNDVEYRVSAIAAGGFQGRQLLTSVHIRAPITAIGDDAFAGCTGLASVELSEGVSAIGAGAFSGTAVQRVVIPASVSTVGARAFADCSNLSQIVAFSNALSVAGDAITGCAGVSIYAPYNETEEYPWHPGLVASGNKIQPYGVSFASDPLVIEVGETADLFEGGTREVPEGCELTYSYAATPISVEAGQVTGKKLGASEVTAVLSIDGIELERVSRAVEVVAGAPMPYISAWPYEGNVTFAFDALGGAPVPSDQTEHRDGGYTTSGSSGINNYNVSPNAAKPADPTKPGYTFLGWYLASAPDALYNFDNSSASYTSVDLVSDKVMLYAKWERIIPDGATGGTIGASGESVTWYITSAGELVITPTNGVSGTLPEYVDDSTFPWVKNANVKTATIEAGVKAGSNMSHLFDGCSELTTINGLGNLSTQNATDIGYLFIGCAKLSGVDLSAFDTSNVASMNNMFNGCASIRELDLSALKTSNVESMGGLFLGCSSLSSLKGLDTLSTAKVVNMRSMFYGCSNITELDVSNFETSNVQGMFEMFRGCSMLTRLDLSTFKTGSVRTMEKMFFECSELAEIVGVGDFDVSKVGDMQNMFYSCSKLTALDLSRWNTESATAMSNMFYGCSGLQSLNLANFNTKKVTTTSNMFAGCSGLESLDVSGFDVSSVVYMGNMFSGCSGLTELDVSGFSTTSVISLDSTFKGCSGLTSLSLSNFDTKNVTTMSGMFEGCSGLQAFDVSGFDVSNVKYMGNMFEGCSSLTALNVSSWNTANVTSMSNMFKGCSGLTSLDVSGFITANVDNMVGMFNGCSGLTSLDVSNFNTEKVVDMSYLFNECSGLTSLKGLRSLDTSNATSLHLMFRNCSGLTTLDVSSFKTSNVENMLRMFEGCSGLVSIDGLKTFDTSSATSLYQMFYGCSQLSSLDLSNFKTGNVTSMQNMFNGCSKLAELNVSTFVTTNVNDMLGMFNGCSGLAALDVSNFDTKNVTDMSYLFNGCSSLASIEGLRNFNTANVATMHLMFGNCAKLTSLDVSSFDTASVTSMQGMFQGCSSLTGIEGVQSLNTLHVESMYQMFYNCSKLSSLDVSNFKTGNVTSMQGMFQGCSGLVELNVSSFVTSQVTDMIGMFSGCSGLTKLGVSNFDTSNVASMAYLFNGCSSLASIEGLRNFDTSNVPNMSYMFNKCAKLATLDLSAFVTSKVTNMTCMFKDCSKLALLDLSSFDTSLVEDKAEVFVGCSALTEAKVGTGYTLGFLAQPSPGYTNNWVNSSGASFAYNAIPTGVADTYKAQLAIYSIAYELNGGTLLNGAPPSYTIKSADITLPTPTWAGFKFIGWYESADFSGDPAATIPTGSTGDKTFYAKWKQNTPADCQASGETGGVTWYITKAGELVLTPTNGVEGVMDDIGADKLAPWNDWRPSVLSLTVDSGVKAGHSLSGAFSDCVNLTSVDLSGLDTSNTEVLSFLFSSCVKLPSIDLSGLNTSKVWDMYALLSRCENMTTANLSGLDTSKVRYMHRMFNECHSLKSLDLSGFNTSIVETADHMFYNCVSLESLDVSGWTIANTNLGGMFENCSSLSSLDLSTWTVTGVSDMATMFKGCALIPSLNLSGWDTSKAKIMVSAFEGCSNLADIALPDGFVGASVTDASKLFFDCPKLTTIPANLSLPESVPANQAFGFSEAPAEFVATAYAGGDSRLLAYDWVSDYRLINGMEAFGTLQTTDNQNRAQWSLDTSGTLTISCEEGAVIADLGWVAIDGAVDTAPTEGAWSAARGLVTRIVMEPGVAAENAGAWFAGMTQLTDISQTYIPAKAAFANSMFSGCTSLSEIPEGFTFPASVTAARSMFRECSSITNLPADFTLKGTSLTDAHAFFYKTGLKYLPDNFAFPEGATNLQHFFSGAKLIQLPETLRLPSASGLYVNRMFADCSYLETLPQGFTIPGNCVGAEQMFQHCSSLKALPEGFSIPQGTGVNMMLYGCSKLTSLPASLKLNSLGLTDAVLKNFLPTSGMVPTYYAGDPADVPAADYWASNWKRQLITSGTLPVGTYSVDFKLPDASGAYPGAAWFTDVTGTDGLLKEMAAPTREGQEFVGWYVDDACTIPFDFTKSVTAQAAEAPNPVATLFARYAESFGSLPTTDGKHRASWSVSRDGVLAIDCEEGAIIEDLKWSYDTTIEGYIPSNVKYWGPLRQRIKSAVMSPSVQVVSMEQWFAWMPQLSDVSNTFIPAGCTSIRALLGGTAITALPDGFTVPQGVQNAQDAFASCGSLTALPAGFIIPDTVTNTQGMFVRCTSLTSLPEGFAIPGSVKNARAMFEYSGLTSLPKGFTLEHGVEDAAWMFHYCRGLSALPEGFSLPTTLADAANMFQDDPTLTSLPSTLDLSALSTQARGTMGAMFKVHDSYQANPLPTFYAGDDVNKVLGQEYWTSQNRKIYVANDPENPLPDTVHLVTFKIPDASAPDGWRVHQSSLTNEATGLVADPGDPHVYGYPLKGWYTSEACTTKFDFNTQITTDDVVVYGAFGAPILRGTVPVTANVVVDTSGIPTSAPGKISSYTPVELVLSSVACETGSGIAGVFPNEADRTKPFATVRFQDQPLIKAPFTGEPTATSVPIPLSTGFAVPGVVDCDISLDLNGAKVQRRTEGYAADVANIMWTIGVKK